MAAKALTLATSNLLCVGKRTVTNLLCTAGRQFEDWSAFYRTFERDRFDEIKMFAALTTEIADRLPKDNPFVVGIDDTVALKRGRKVHGAKWRADRKGPKFRVNFVWGQRYLQISAAMPEAPGGPCAARMLPIGFVHCPSPPKPRKGAMEEEIKEYKNACAAQTVTKEAVKSLGRVRSDLDDNGHRDRLLVAVGDGGFTNKTTLKNLPERTVFIGRIRKDAELFASPEQEPGMGRPRLYGSRLPTPDEIRQDEKIEWKTVEAFAADKIHQFQVKSHMVRWKAVGGKDIRLLVIRPLAYRPPGSPKTCYRDPAYLIVTDPNMTLEKVIQYYVWRWEIEVNFRDEKQLLGTGQAHVRSERAVRNLPALTVASYTLLHLACQTAMLQATHLPLPKWRNNSPPRRLTTQQAISLFRASAWSHELRLPTFDRFTNAPNEEPKPLKVDTPFQSAIIYAQLC